MGCRSSTPLDVVDAARHEHFRRRGGRGDGGVNNNNERTATATTTTLDIFTLADLAAFEDRSNLRQRPRGRRNRRHEERMADILALQQSLAAMEDFFQQLVLGQTTGFYMEAMDPNNNNAHGGPPPASDVAIASLVKSKLTIKDLKLLPNKMCSVCCEALEALTSVSRLPCGHVYHPHCVEPWLHRHCTCPSCRYELPTDDESFEEGRASRMALRKLPLTEQDDESTSSHSSDDDETSRPDTTWEGYNSGGEEGVHLMDGFQDWYEDFREADHPGQDLWVGNGVRSLSLSRQGHNQGGSWMLRLMDQDNHQDRPSITLPAASMQHSNQDDAQRMDAPYDEVRVGEQTPRASNTTETKSRDFGTDSTDELVASIEQDECIMPAADATEASW